MRSIWAGFLGRLGAGRFWSGGVRGRRRWGGGLGRSQERASGSLEGLESRVLPTTVTWTIDEGNYEAYEVDPVFLGLTDLWSVTTSVGQAEFVDNGIDPLRVYIYINGSDGPDDSRVADVVAEDILGNSASFTLNWIVRNVAPTIQFQDEFGDLVNSIDPLEFTEGEGAWLEGLWSDPGEGGDGVEISASVGTVSMSSDGRWTWAGNGLDGDQTVTLTATDKDGGESQITFALNELNLDPLLNVVWEDVEVWEGETEVSNFGSWWDAGLNGDGVTFSASVGTVDFDGDYWYWSHDLPLADYPIAGEWVTISAYDQDGGFAEISFTVSYVNVAPCIYTKLGELSVDEGKVAWLTGGWVDPGPGGDGTVITANIGEIIFDENGNWEWWYQTTDGPDESQWLTITATDKDGGTESEDFPLHVRNVSPTLVPASSSAFTFSGQPASMTGTWSDPGVDVPTMSSNIGEVIVNEDGTWLWRIDEIASSETVVITATDECGCESFTYFDLVIVEDPLAADFMGSGATEGDTADMTGTWSDLLEPFNLTSSIGYVSLYEDGTWRWIFDTTDGPEDSQTVTITATYLSGIHFSISFELYVWNVSPEIEADASRVTFESGELVSVTGTWFDPGDDEILLNSSFGSVVKNPDGTWVWSYQTDETTPDLQNVEIWATDESGYSTWIYVEVANRYQKPTNLVAFGGSVVEDQVFSLTGSFDDPNASEEHQVRVAWGDGVTEIFTLPVGARSFAFNHAYSTSSSGQGGGVYGVSLAVSDNGGTTWIPMQGTTRASIASSGIQGDGVSDWASISADGRFVVFESFSQSLGSVDTEWYIDIFLKDRMTGQLIPISMGWDGSIGNGHSYQPSISADGRYVAFTSSADNLVTGDVNGESDIFIYDRMTGTVELVSVNSDEEQGDSYSHDTSISGDGRYVTFVSAATNFSTVDTSHNRDVYVRDRLLGTTTLVSVTLHGTTGDGGADEPKISADGRYVSFSSRSSNYVSGDLNRASDVFVRDLQSGTTRRVSVSSSGEEGNNYSSDSRISADGRYVLFSSYSTNLSEGDNNYESDVFLHDLETGETFCVSLNSAGEVGDDRSGPGSVSAAGRYVVFHSDSSNLSEGDTGYSRDIFVRDRISGVTVRLSQNEAGEEGNFDSFRPVMSDDGRFIVFTSESDNLMKGDTNLLEDVFVMANPLLPLLSVEVSEANDAPVLDADGAPVLDGITLNVSAGSNPGTLVSDIIARMLPSGGISDEDAGAVFGIAINGLGGTATGTWEYTLDGGTTWLAVGTVNNDGARLLAADGNTRLRYKPNAGFLGEVKISFVAWDQTSGTNGGLGVTKNRGGASTFSVAYEYASLFVTNTAPVLYTNGNPLLDSVLQNVSAAGIPGTLVSDILSRMGPSGGMSDSDSGTHLGIAINGLSSANGTWEYTVNNGVNWSPIGTTGNSSARLLAADGNTRIRFVPNSGFVGEAKLAFVAWDRTSGANGGVANVNSRGGVTPYSLAYEYASLLVVNQAPVLTASNAAHLDGIATDIPEGSNLGTRVSDLIARMGPTGGISDPNPAALSGIAINGLGGTANGTWEYSIDGGTSWNGIGTTGNSNARLLSAGANTRVRFRPNLGFTGSVKLAFVAWDQTSGVNGGVANVGTRGGGTAFSALYDYAAVSVG